MQKQNETLKVKCDLARLIHKKAQCGLPVPGSMCAGGENLC